MDMTRLSHLIPTLGMVGEYFAHRGWRFTSSVSRREEQYANARLFTGAAPARAGVLYVLKPGQTGFPTDTHAYVCTTPIPGAANHLCCPEQTTEEVLDALMELYEQYARREERLNDLVFQGALWRSFARWGRS